MVAQVLSREAVRRALSSLRDDLGRADRVRLDSIFELIAEDGRIRLGDALRTLYPDQEREAALTAFRQFRARLGSAAGEAGIAFALETDGQTRAPPEERWCWFTGQDDAAAAAAKLTEAETAGVERSAQNAVEIGGKQLVRYFVCYAHGDRALKEDLLTRLQHCFGAAKGCTVSRAGTTATSSSAATGTSGFNERSGYAISACCWSAPLFSPALTSTSTSCRISSTAIRFAPPRGSARRRSR